MCSPGKRCILVITSSANYTITLPELILRRFLEEHSFNPVFICPEEGSLTRFLRETNSTVSPVPHIGEWRRLAVRLISPCILRKLRRIARVHEVVLVHAARLSVTPFAVKLARQLAVPCISHLHGVPPRPDKFNRYLAHQADVLIAVSKGALHQYRPAGGNKAVVIYNGMDIQAFRRRAAEIDVRSKLAIRDHLLVGITGLSFRKGIDIFIQAAGKVAKANSKARFLIMGGLPAEGREKHRFRAMLKSAGIIDTVFLPGFPENMAPYMAAADLWVVPSRDDAAPMVVMEAMSLAKPVLGSNVGGIPELIQNEVTGYVLPCGDSTAFAEAMLELLANHTKRLSYGQESSKWAEAHFDYSIYSQRMWNIYSELLNR